MLLFIYCLSFLLLEETKNSFIDLHYYIELETESTNLIVNRPKVHLETQKMLPNCDLPGDVMADILSRLPIKSLLRFRCVCKPWCNFVTTPNFVALHLNRNIISTSTTNAHKLLALHFEEFSAVPAVSLFCGERFDAPVKVHVPFHDNFEIMGSCNGLLCVRIWDGETLILWNPSTRKFRPLPRPRIVVPEGEFGCYCFGFGFDPKTNDYKLVRIVNGAKGLQKVDVYTLSTDSWREIKSVVPCFVYGRSGAVFVNGFLYWEAISLNFQEDKGHYIVSFDMGDEVFRQITSPGVINEFYTRNLLVFKNSPAVVVSIFLDNTNRYYDIWVMNACGAKESWTKQFTIGAIHKDAWPWWCWKTCELVFGFMDNSGNKLLLYDPAVQKVKQFPNSGAMHVDEVFNYMESLVSVRRGFEVLEQAYM